MAKIIPILRTHADTRRIIFKLASNEEPTGVDITNWTVFELNVDPAEAPPTDINNVANLSGIIIDALTGRVGFIPTGLVPSGNYYYNAKGTDSNGEIITFAKGKFTIEQDI